MFAFIRWGMFPKQHQINGHDMFEFHCNCCLIWIGIINIWFVISWANKIIQFYLNIHCKYIQINVLSEYFRNWALKGMEFIHTLCFIYFCWNISLLSIFNSVFSKVNNINRIDYTYYEHYTYLKSLNINININKSFLLMIIWNQLKQFDIATRQLLFEVPTLYSAGTNMCNIQIFTQIPIIFIIQINPFILHLNCRCNPIFFDSNSHRFPWNWKFDWSKKIFHISTIIFNNQQYTI